MIGCGITAYAVFSAGFSNLLNDFVAAVIAWIGPWMAIFLVDWLLRRQRYVPAELQRTDSGGLYWRQRRGALAGAGRPGPRLAGVDPGLQPDVLRRPYRPGLRWGRSRLQRVHRHRWSAASSTLRWPPPAFGAKRTSKTSYWRDEA